MKKKINFNKFSVALLSILTVLVVVRVSLPYAVKWYINDELANLESYSGHVNDVSLSLWRGAYQIKDLSIQKKTGKIPVPFVDVRQVDLAIDWRAVLKMSLVARIYIDTPEINFVDSKVKKKQQNGSEESWDKLLAGSFPIKLDRFEIVNGRVHFKNFDTSPPLDFSLTQIHLTLNNLTNSLKVSKTLAATGEFTAKAMSQANLDGSLHFNPLAKDPEFELKFRIMNLNLVKLNPFLMHYVQIDFAKGDFDVVTEIASSHRKLSGYIKPLFRNFAVLKGPKDFEKKTAIEKVKEVAVAAVMQVFKNQKKDQFATVLPIEGTIDAKETRIWPVIVNIFKNAFIHAFVPKYDE